jgi:hypothetical protein
MTIVHAKFEGEGHLLWCRVQSGESSGRPYVAVDADPSALRRAGGWTDRALCLVCIEKAKSSTNFKKKHMYGILRYATGFLRREASHGFLYRLIRSSCRERKSCSHDLSQTMTAPVNEDRILSVALSVSRWQIAAGEVLLSSKRRPLMWPLIIGAGIVAAAWFAGRRTRRRHKPRQTLDKGGRRSLFASVGWSSAAMTDVNAESVISG